jgi:hypothetical protein
MKNTIKHVTQEQLEGMFLNFNKEVSLSGVTFGDVIYQNDVSKSRQKGGKKVMQKVKECRITLGSDYETKVNKIHKVKQGMEGDFKANKMLGKSYVNGKENPVVRADKNPNFKMLVMICEAHNRKHNKTTYLHNGQIITLDEAKELNLLQPSFFDTKKTAGRGSVSEENDFDYLTLGFDKIKQITLNKTTYIVIR